MVNVGIDEACEETQSAVQLLISYSRSVSITIFLHKCNSPRKIWEIDMGNSINISNLQGRSKGTLV